jgi:catechol 2,3-dioxygenase-like lactoylglutathione lyase family enzyme
MAARRGIDHIVLAVGRLDDAARCYEALGFTLTPRAQHNTAMGTSNRLAQLAGGNFIELLEVDRPATLEPHDFAASPPRFSFGAHNRDFVERRDGLSMLVLAGDDSRADVAAFRKAGIDTYQPFDFERQATLPGGARVTVAFSLAFATSPAMPQIAFFTCHNKTPQHFWKPAFQHHANGARRIAAVYLVAEEPERHRKFLGALTGGPVTDIDGGLRVQCGAEELLVLSPSRLIEVAPAAYFDLSEGPRFAGFAIEAAGPARPLTPVDEACGAFIEWRRA